MNITESYERKYALERIAKYEKDNERRIAHINRMIKAMCETQNCITNLKARIGIKK